MGRKYVFQEASGGRGAGKDWTKSLKNCQKMSHEDELNRDDCSLSAFVWYQTLLLPPLLTPLFVISLYNYSSYGISNTPDIFQCQQDQNQPWETFLYVQFQQQQGCQVTEAIYEQPALRRALKNLTLRSESFFVYLLFNRLTTSFYVQFCMFCWMKALAARTVGIELLAVMLLFSPYCVITRIKIGLTCSQCFPHSII